MKFRLIILLCLALLVACDSSSNEPPSISPNTPTAASAEISTVPIIVETDAETAEVAAILPTTIPTSPPATATPRSLAATVNNSTIYLDQFTTRLAQFQNWYPTGTPDGSDLRQFTLDNMITQIVLEQAAEANGIMVSAETVQNAIDQAIADSGGDEAYQVWLTQSGHDEASFRLQVTDEILAQAVVGFITKDVPLTADYVRARYIQVDDFETAQTVQSELQAGADFATLVDLYSIEPSKETTHGDLGFFRRDTLLVSAVETAAFALDLNAISDIVLHERTDGSQTFFLVQTVEVQFGRKLSAQEYSEALQTSFEAWLTNQLNTATIEKFIDN